jgi:hypothetical protein
MKDQIKATFDADTKRCHRFIIDEGQDIKGTLYVTKGEDIPDSVTIYLKTKGQRERDKLVEKTQKSVKEMSSENR